MYVVVADGQTWRLPAGSTTPIPGLMDWLAASVVVQTSVVHSRGRMFSTLAVRLPIGSCAGRRTATVTAGGGLNDPPEPVAVSV